MHLHRCESVIENTTKALHVRQIRHDAVAVTAMVQDKESDLKMVQIGAGTTPGAFQIQPLTAIHAATVIHVNETEEIVTRVKVNATWNVHDDESDIKHCTCSVGMFPYKANIQDQWYADNQSSCESTLLQLKHGDKVYVNIKCVNNVELATTTTVASNTLSINFTKSNDVTVKIIPVNEAPFSTIPITVAPTKIQSNKSLVQISWSEFKHTSGIDYYEYCISDERNTIIVDWTNVQLKTVASAHGLILNNAEKMNVSVRATNTGQYTSEAVNASLFTISEPSALSGNPMLVSRNGHIIHIDWKPAFFTIPDFPVVYSLIVGSRKGFTDILDINYYTGHTYDIAAPSSTLISPNITELFFT
ncbi:hypothetical protein MAR_022568, partial [Mya arenaria]